MTSNVTVQCPYCGGRFVIEQTTTDWIIEQRIALEAALLNIIALPFSMADAGAALAEIIRVAERALRSLHGVEPKGTP